MNSRDEVSKTLQSIVGHEISTHDFFEQVWQKECKIFRSATSLQQPQPSNGAVSSEDEACHSPLNSLVCNASPALLSLLQEARGRYGECDSADDNTMVPILFCNGQSVSPEPYGYNLFHAYLDGCSVVLNHADWSSAEIARVCLDLQKNFPHCYANTYLTPPASQAVPPHADDRDVFVIQLLGKKHWKVYQTVPIAVRQQHTSIESLFSREICFSHFKITITAVPVS